MVAGIEEKAPAPRLCHIVRWSDFDGYGFNLHSDKVRQAQLIGKVDEGSPAEAAGLKKGDRIVEVNGVNITNENHRQVVERIRAIPDETRLLVVDAETDLWYTERRIVITGTLKNVVYLQNASTRNGVVAEELQSAEPEPDPVPPPVPTGEADNTPVPEPRRPSVASSKSTQSEVEIHPPPKHLVHEPEESPIETTAPEEGPQPEYTENPVQPESASVEIRPRSISKARREFFRQEPEENGIDLHVLGYPLDYVKQQPKTQSSTAEKATESSLTETDKAEAEPAMETVQERVVVEEVKNVDDVSTPLVGYRSVSEAETDEVNNENLDRERSRAGSRVSEKVHNAEGEHIEEVVTRTPVFETSSADKDAADGKEHVFEKVEVQQVNGFHKNHHEDVKEKDSGNEDSRSNTNSISSADSSSVKVNGHYDVTMSDDARTPSPTPAVASAVPQVTNGHRSVPEPEPRKPRPEYGNLALNMSAKELRAQIAERSKKRDDPRKKPIDLFKKYEMVNNM